MGQFIFSSLTVDGSMQTDLSLTLTLYLLDVILDDTRVNKCSGNQVIRYMERKRNNNEDESLQNTIDIKYKQTLTGSDSNYFLIILLNIINYFLYLFLF